MPIYFDTNVFYNAYCPIEDRIAADWVLNQISSEFPCITSEWTVAEMFRAFKKQVNLKKIEDHDAQVALNLFLSDIGEYSQKKKLKLIPIKMSFVIASRPLIFNQNLYAADAIHLITAIQMNADAFITFDSDFEKLKNIQVWNPKQANFQSLIMKLKEKYQKE